MAEQALAKLGLSSGDAALRPLDPRQSTLGDLRGFDWLTEVERNIGGRVFAVQLFFMDGQLVTVQSYTPVLPGETFADAVAAVRGSLHPGLEFKLYQPNLLLAYDAAGTIWLGSQQADGAPTQIEMSYFCADFNRLEAVHLQRWRRAKLVEDSIRQARIKVFERDYALSFGGDEVAPKELLHGRKTAPVVAPPAPEAAPAAPKSAPKIRRPTPAQRRQQAARRAWWRRTLKLPTGKPTSLIFHLDGMIRPQPTFRARTPHRFA